MTPQSPEVAKHLQNIKQLEAEGQWQQAYILLQNLIGNYGLGGMHIWLQNHRFEYEGLYYLNQLPTSCPWQFEITDEIDQVIDHNFHPVKDKLIETIAILNERCQHIFALLYKGNWYLLYVIKIILRDNTSTFEVYGGGQPTTKPKLVDEVYNLGWTIPEELKLLYQVHNGFGSWRVSPSNTILPDRKLNVIGQYIDKHEITDYDPNNLLEFFPDGAGNGQCFYRSDENTQDLWTVMWDHETRELYDKESFWEFVDRELSKVDEERFNSKGELIE